MRHIVTIVCLCNLMILAGAALPAPAQTSEPLQWRLTAGRSLQIEVQQDMTQQMDFAGAPMKTENSTKTWMTWQVREINPQGNAVVDATVTRVLMTMNAPMMGNVTIDTDSDEAQQGMAAQIAESLRPMVGVSIEQIMSPRGEILEINFPEEVATEADAAQLATVGSPSDMIQQVSQGAVLAFPDEPLSVGKTWESEIEQVSPLGSVTVTNRYRYEGLVQVDSQSLHKIDVDTSVQFANGDNDMDAKIEVVEQDSTGFIYFDSVAGRIDRSEVEQKMTMNISIAGQEMSNTTVQLVKLRVTE